MVSKLNSTKKSKQTGSSVKNVILAIAIAIIFAFFVGYTIQAFYPEPSYEDYCDYDIRGPSKIEQQITEEACIEKGGEWESFPVMKNEDELKCNRLASSDNSSEIRLVCQEINNNKNTGYCQENFSCSSEYDSAREKYDKIYFIISLVIGIIVFVLSAIMKLVSVSSGLMVGSVFVMFVGTVKYWRYSSDILRVLILGLVLGILIWLGYKKLNK